MSTKNQRVTELVFDADEVQEHVEWSRQAEEFSPTFAQMCDPKHRKDGDEVPEGEFPTKDEVDLSTLDPALHLVKDEGVYLMTNAANWSVFSEDGPSEPIYASGLGPESTFDSWVRAVGGDDFVRLIPLEWWEKRTPEERERGVFKVEAVMEGRRLHHFRTDVYEE